MQLPDFIKRALAFFDTAEKELKASAEAKTKIVELEKAAQQKETAIQELQGKFTKAEGLVAAHEATIKDLQGQVAKEKTKANAVIAGQGVPADQVPAAEATNGAAAAINENAWNKYQRLLAEDPRAAGAFWAQNADKIMASRFEKK